MIMNSEEDLVDFKKKLEQEKMSAIESKAKSLVSTKADDPCCQRICDLPDDLLLQILLHVPTKNAVTTEILSKRWRHMSGRCLKNSTSKTTKAARALGGLLKSHCNSIRHQN